VGLSVLWRKRPPLRLPEGIRIYAIGDVHGRADLLEQVFSRIDAHMAAHPVDKPIQVLVGDYIDRGPYSREVLDRLIERSGSNKMVVSLKGNHETFIPEFVRNPSTFQSWSQMGGLATLMSYGVTPSLNPDAPAQKELAMALDAALPRSHRLFLAGLKSSFSCGGFFFAHAGVRPGIPLAEQREADLLWIRDEFLLHEERFAKIVVHGHTAVRAVDMRPNRINIDTGAYATGNLSCVIIERNEVDVL
jgi:serine/threonine protein phosphatase 1